MSLLKVTQDRWNKIFEAGCNYEGEQTYIDFEKLERAKTLIGKPWTNFSALSAIYYEKSVIANLKANLVKMNNSKKSLPKTKGKNIQMYYSYPVK
jgi:hypothetical protein